jgi:hypothetical protein
VGSRSYRRYAIMVDVTYCQDGGFREFLSADCDVKIEEGYIVFNKIHIKLEDIKEIKIITEILEEG